jgi:hypothetical protein
MPQYTPPPAYLLITFLKTIEKQAIKNNSSRENSQEKVLVLIKKTLLLPIVKYDINIFYINIF